MKTLAGALVSCLPAAFAQTTGYAYFGNVIEYTQPNSIAAPTAANFAALTCKLNDGATDITAGVTDLYPNTGTVTGNQYDTGILNSCGSSVADPCIVGMNGVTADEQGLCGTCYKMKIVNPAVTATDDPLCATGGCPAWNSTEIYTVVRGGLTSVPDTITNSTDRVFDVSNLGFYHMCPVVCGTNGTSAGTKCVGGASSCAGGAQLVNNNALVPSGPVLQTTPSVTAAQPIEYSQVDCGSGNVIVPPAASGAGAVVPATMTIVGLLAMAAVWTA